MDIASGPQPNRKGRFLSGYGPNLTGGDHEYYRLSSRPSYSRIEIGIAGEWLSKMILETSSCKWRYLQLRREGSRS